MFPTAANFLFDFDGTLVDSESLHDRAFRTVLEQTYPAALSTFAYEHIKGMTTDAAFAFLGIEDPARIETCTAEKRRLYREAVHAGDLPLISGARELLTLLGQAGKRLFLVTAGSNGSVHAALEKHGIGAVFEGMVTGEPPLASKPAPDLYLECLRRYRLQIAEAVAVEDAKVGIESAMAAGLRVVGVNNPLIANLADVFYPDLDAMNAAARAFLQEKQST